MRHSGDPAARLPLCAPRHPAAAAPPAMALGDGQIKRG
eukprot:gene55323-49641_t